MAQTAVEQSPQGSTVSQTVVTAVAELTDSEPLALDPLYTVVDADALNRLFETDGPMGKTPKRVEFTYAGCEVVVSADGTVSVSRAGQELSKQWT